MRYIALALACEGPTDFRFLGDLLRRLVESSILAADEMWDVGEVVPVLSDSMSHTNQIDEVAAQFEDRRMYADILFVHTDAGKDVEDALSTRVEPLRKRIAALGDSPAVVAVVPDRETEAWMLADPRAVADVLGVDRSLIKVSVPSKRVASVLDPKAELSSVADSVDTGSGRVRAVRRRGSRLNQLYDGLGSEASVSVLATVPAFKQLQTDLESFISMEAEST